MYICLQRWKEDHGIKARIMVCLMNVEPCCLRLCIISLKGNHSKVIFRFRFDFFPLIQFTYKKGLVGQNFLYYFFFKFHLFKHVCQMTEIVCLFCVELEPTEPCICIKKGHKLFVLSGSQINFLCRIAIWATEILKLLAQVKMTRAASGVGGLFPCILHTFLKEIKLVENVDFLQYINIWYIFLDF